MGVELDGSQTIKAWGMGKNRADAVEQARKNGVRDVLFKGILDGKQGCEMKPLVPEVNAQQKYEDYFNTFFADSGAYSNFVSNKDESLWSKQKMKAGTEVQMGVIMRILRVELKKQLIQDNILIKQ
jgi:translation elongation factor P/translation initiation factor 5A